MANLDGHRSAERRSVAYHRRIAQKLLHRPELVQEVRAKLYRAAAGERPDHYAERWKALLDRPLDELVAFMISDSPEARDCRQSSPFAGLLTPTERWEVWKTVL